MRSSFKSVCFLLLCLVSSAVLLASDATLRVQSLNLWWKDSRHRIRALAEELGKDPQRRGDIILVQESLYDDQSRTSTSRQVADALDYGSVFVQRPGDSEGLAVLSRFPILKSSSFVLVKSPRENFSRIALYCQILIRGKKVGVYNVHLSSPDEDGAIRRIQIREVMKTVNVNREDEMIVLGGDFNSTPQSPEISALLRALGAEAISFNTALPSWTDIHSVIREPKFAQAPWDHPEARRLDYLFYRVPPDSGLRIKSGEQNFVLDHFIGRWVTDHRSIVDTLELQFEQN